MSAVKMQEKFGFLRELLSNYCFNNCSEVNIREIILVLLFCFINNWLNLKNLKSNILFHCCQYCYHYLVVIKINNYFMYYFNNSNFMLNY